MLDIHSKLAGIIKSWIFWLIIVTSIAIVVRSIPAWTNAAWGSDLGIYYGLTNSFVDSKALFSSYDGWGQSYQYFPILYAITGAVHWISGIDTLILLPKIAPIFGGLTVFILYFIVYELVKRRDVALLSAGFMAVAAFHAYQTSHAAPLTIGHFFMLLSLYFYLKYAKQILYFIPLIISTLLLIMSHHMTTYFYLISMLMIIVFKNIKTDIKDLKKDIIYLSVASSLTFLYWYIVATPVFNGFMNMGALNAGHIIGLFYLFFCGSIIGIHLIKHHNSSLAVLGRKFLLRKVVISHRRAVTLLILTIAFFIGAEFVFFYANFPTSIVRMSLVAVVYSIPLLVFVGLSVMGLEYLKGLKNKWFFQGWVLALFSSLVFSIISGKLYPDRHIEYLMVPMCVLSSYALLAFFEGRLKSFHLPHLSGKFKPAGKWLPILIAIVIIGSSGVAIYPVKNYVGGIDERISDPCLNTIQWATDNIDKNTSVFATDLRLSKMLWAEGFNTTFQYTNETWCTDNWIDCIHDLDYNANHSRVTHIMIDDIMRTVVVDLAVLRNVYMTNESYNKFFCSPFELIYRNATLDNQMKEVHWTEIYEVNWTYIDELSSE